MLFTAFAFGGTFSESRRHGQQQPVERLQQTRTEPGVSFFFGRHISGYASRGGSIQHGPMPGAHGDTLSLACVSAASGGPDAYQTNSCSRSSTDRSFFQPQQQCVDGKITVVNRPGLEVRVCECYQVVKKEFDRPLPECSVP